MCDLDTFMNKYLVMQQILSLKTVVHKYLRE